MSTENNVGIIDITYDIVKEEGKLTFINPQIKMENFDDIAKYPGALEWLFKELAYGAEQAMLQVSPDVDLPKFGFYIKAAKDSLYENFKPKEVV